METTEGNLVHVFCDESRTSGDRYMVFGGIIVPHSHVTRIKDEINKFREEKGWFHEFKWEKVSRGDFELCKMFLDFYFANSSVMYYKALVIDTTQVDKSSDEKENIFYKWYYHLLCFSFGKYVKNGRILVNLDQRDTKYKLATLKDILDRGLRKNFNCQFGCVSAIEPHDSKKNQFIQLADVLTGAIGYELNSWHEKPNASVCKVALMEHIKASVGLETFWRNTPPNEHKFSIWHFKIKRKTP
jgi:hypothetical protein